MNKKIIFLIPTLSLGGGERVVSELSLNLPESIEKVIVLFKKEISYPYKGRIISLDIPLPLKSSFLKVYHYFFGLLKFKKIITSEKPDYVVSFGHPANIMNILSRLGVFASRTTLATSGSRAIVRVDNFYSSSLPGFSGSIYKFLIKILFNRAEAIVDVSKESARDLVEHFGVRENKIKVIYNPLNIKEIERLAKEPLSESHQAIFKNPVIINMGRLNLQKGQKYLIGSFAKIKKKVKNAKLVILGKGELEDSLRDLSEKAGIKDDIYFLGWQANPFKFLARSKIFALSSLWEGLPYVVLEAMACALPIVSFDCKSGPREILSPASDFSHQAKDIEYAEYGVLVNPGDEDMLSQAVVKMLSDDHVLERYKEKSKKRAIEFDIKNIIQEWEFLQENGKN